MPNSSVKESEKSPIRAAPASRQNIQNTISDILPITPARAEMADLSDSTIISVSQNHVIVAFVETLIRHNRFIHA
jgi:hypothetical protein